MNIIYFYSYSLVNIFLIYVIFISSPTLKRNDVGNLLLYSNMVSFFRFASKRGIYVDDKISLAHARCTHYAVVNVLNIYIH